MFVCNREQIQWLTNSVPAMLVYTAPTQIETFSGDDALLITTFRMQSISVCDRMVLNGIETRTDHKPHASHLRHLLIAANRRAHVLIENNPEGQRAHRSSGALLCP